MERLTIPDEKIEGGVRRTVIDARKVKENAMTIYWALKKYEDTGLAPEQIQRLKDRDAAKAPEMHGNNPSKTHCTCPKCDLILMYKDASGWHGKYYGFCPRCGQRLKWKE